jgi:mono/diheme cytochrome c family protein
MREALAAGVVAALVALGLVELTVGIGGGDSNAAGGSPPPGSTQVARTDSRSGHAVFVRMGCGACHTLAAAGSKGEFGPNLDERLPQHTRESLVARIMARPGSFIDMAGMPTNFRDRLRPGELDALVDFLLAAHRAPRP